MQECVHVVRFRLRACGWRFVRMFMHVSVSVCVCVFLPTVLLTELGQPVGQPVGPPPALYCWWLEWASNDGSQWITWGLLASLEWCPDTTTITPQGSSSLLILLTTRTPSMGKGSLSCFLSLSLLEHFLNFLEHMKYLSICRHLYFVCVCAWVRACVRARVCVGHMGSTWDCTNNVTRSVFHRLHLCPLVINHSAVAKH